MREITPEPFTVFKLDELQPDARRKAIESVAEKLGGDWWDQSDIDSISETIVYKLAEVLGSPGWDEFGESDFPGIAGVKLAGWDLGRADTLNLSGTLTPENAAALPWVEGAIAVRLADTRWHGTTIDVEWDEDPDAAADADISSAIGRAINQAKQAGREEMDYKSSTEYAEEWIQAQDCEFYADGRLFT